MQTTRERRNNEFIKIGRVNHYSGLKPSNVLARRSKCLALVLPCTNRVEEEYVHKGPCPLAF
jgi:hypothetical protein